MRILIADDNDHVRGAIRTLLSSTDRLQICGEAADSSQALQKAQELRPDLVLLDISMPGANGFDTARAIRREIPEVKILLITHHDAARFLPSALESGADGCLEKSSLSAGLLEAIDKISDLQRAGITPK